MLDLTDSKIKCKPVHSGPKFLYGQAYTVTSLQQRCDYMFIPIPKCASSWMKCIFKHSNRINFLQSDIDNPTHNVVVLRDPIDRYITGLAQTIDDENNFGKVDIIEQLWTKPIFQSSHLEPQVSFLDGISIDPLHTTFFMCNSNLDKNFWRWALDKNITYILNTKCSQVYDFDNSFNLTSKKSKIVQSFCRDLRRILRDNPELQEQIKKIYEDDYRLLDSITLQ